MESVHPPADSQVSRVPAQRTPPGQAGTEPVAPPRAPRRRLRRTLVVIGAALALFCLAGTALAYVAYDRYTAPDRGDPGAAVNGYLQAYLVDGNDVVAEQLVCADPALDQMRALRDELRSREEKFHVTFDVKWGPLEVRPAGSSAEVLVELQIRYADGGLFQVDHLNWRFVTRDDDGWLVCEATRVS